MVCWCTGLWSYDLSCRNIRMWGVYLVSHSLSLVKIILCLSLWVDCPKEWFLIVIRQKTKVEQQNETTTEFYLTQMHTEFNEYLVQSVAPERFSASKDSKNNYMQIKIVTRWHDHDHIMHALKVNSRTNKVNSKLV